MTKKLLYAGVIVAAAVVLLVMIAAAASAAPTQRPTNDNNPITSAITTLQTQVAGLATQVDTLVTKDAAQDTQDQTVQTNLNTETEARTAADTALDAKIASGSTPAEPVRYEYCLGEMINPNSDGNMQVLDYVENWGDTPAEVSSIRYYKSGISEPWVKLHGGVLTVQPGEGQTVGPVMVFTNAYSYKTKITTNSKYIVPTVYIYDINGHLLKEYLPGDFLKVESYS